MLSWWQEFQNADLLVVDHSKDMGLTCRHVLAARHHLQSPLFTMDGIWPRWLKHTDAENHRIFCSIPDNNGQ